jgi:hypothetical protein
LRNERKREVRRMRLISGGKKSERERTAGGCRSPRNVLSATEQDGHDQRMGKPDLDAVDKAVPCALEDGEVVMVPRVVEDGL